MNVEKAAHKCSHRACSCEVPFAESYCSAVCEHATKTPNAHLLTHQCACAHADCRNSHAPDAAEPGLPR